MSESDLYFRQIPVGPMGNFVYMVGSNSARECFVVDPAWETHRLIDMAAEDDMKIIGALVTHYHPDHVGGEFIGFACPGGVGTLIAAVDVPIHVNKHEGDGMKQITGISESDMVRHETNDKLTVGNIEIELLHTPGHTPGSQCFMVRDQNDERLVAGDTLFVDGCGRVDLPGADPEAMYDTLSNRLAKLGDDVVLYPGHDYGPTPHATMGSQKKTNMHLRMRSREDWLRLRGA